MRIEKWLKLYRYPVLRRVAFHAIKAKGCEIPLSVKIGDDVLFPHEAVGSVLHPDTSLGDHVKVYQNVTVGRGDIWRNPSDDFEGFRIEEGVVLCAGSKIINSHGLLVIGEYSIVGANSVVTESVPPYSIVAGIPAKVIKKREKVDEGRECS